ncbi:MAG: methionine adenosyltransferase [Mycoplasmoidaceae bacterium]|nr:MAG: methionine adenosyltransferase [Mycoplasmoidaceae bacterium]
MKIIEKKKTQTCESVGCGHPDKFCDFVADSILTAYLKVDSKAHIACEVCAFNKTIVIGGEFNSSKHIDKINIAKQCLKKIWPEYYSEYEIIDKSTIQSSEINSKVSINETSIGAGDQGITVGYACNENSYYLPTAHVLASLIMKEINESNYKDFYKDTKTLVSIDENNEAKIILAVSHKKNYNKKNAEVYINNLISKIIKKNKFNIKKFAISLNMAGDFTIHGSIGDSGLTGRKLAVDTYGSIANHGGGAFSGKDYTKVDRSGAYYARWIAKNIVANKLADIAEVRLSWEIGNPKPITIEIECFKTNKIPMADINAKVLKNFNLTVYEIIKTLNLKTINYAGTTNYCHFIGNHSWEKIIKLK